MSKKGSHLYAIAKGRRPGIYNSWDEAKLQVDGFAGAVYKKFKSREDAEQFIEVGSYSKSGGPPAPAMRNSPGASSPMDRYNSSRSYSTWQKPQGAGSSWGGRGERRRSNPYSTAARGVNYNRRYNADHGSAQAGQHGLQVDDEGFAVAYTDGACERNGKSGAKAGIGVFWNHGHDWNVSSPVEGRKATNNAGEIQAITKAVATARKAGIPKVCVRTDSQFAINCVERWLPGWKSNGWKTASKQDVKNREDLQKLDEALQNTPQSMLHVKFEHVRGHSGVLGNEMADRLAAEGARAYSPY